MLLLLFVLSLPLFNAEEPKPLFSFEKGRVGVNFLGFHASAGLGGLITGNKEDGGLHAEAGTPFGQHAIAGSNGQLDSKEGGIGALFAGARAIPGVEAAAGVGGAVSDKGTEQVSYAGAVSPGRESHVLKINRRPNKDVEEMSDNN